VDRIDRKIIAELGRDSSLTSEELGVRIGLSTSAAHRRVKALEKAGMILGYRALLSAEARGNPTTLFVQVTLEKQIEAALETFDSPYAHVLDAICLSLPEMDDEARERYMVLINEGPPAEMVGLTYLGALKPFAPAGAPSEDVRV